MRGLVARVKASWTGARPPVWLQVLGPILGVFYTLVVLARNTLYDHGLLRVARVSAPVISIGNLATGGTGKTPFSAWLVKMLLQDGHSAALLTRGYGDDENRLHRRWNPDAPVMVGGDRVASAQSAIGGGAEVLVLDDGFQHRRLGRDIDIVLVAAEHPLTVRTLPLGPYREPVSALGRADIVLLGRRTATSEEVAAWRRQIQVRAPTALIGVIEFCGGGWKGMEGEAVPAPTGELLAVAGVVQAEAFRTMVGAETGAEVELLAFADHHAYDGADVDRIVRAAGPRTVVTTEKDAVKLQGIQGLSDDVRVLCLDIKWVEGRPEIEARIRGILHGGQG
jgi:tetraacyldisaccharide 4'-kinase